MNIKMANNGDALHLDYTHSPGTAIPGALWGEENGRYSYQGGAWYPYEIQTATGALTLQSAAIEALLPPIPSWPAPESQKTGTGEWPDLGPVGELNFSVDKAITAVHQQAGNEALNMCFIFIAAPIEITGPLGLLPQSVVEAQARFQGPQRTHAYTISLDENGNYSAVQQEGLPPCIESPPKFNFQPKAAEAWFESLALEHYLDVDGRVITGSHESTQDSVFRGPLGEYGPEFALILEPSRGHQSSEGVESYQPFSVIFSMGDGRLMSLGADPRDLERLDEDGAAR